MRCTSEPIRRSENDLGGCDGSTFSFILRTRAFDALEVKDGIGGWGKGEGVRQKSERHYFHLDAMISLMSCETISKADLAS